MAERRQNSNPTLATALSFANLGLEQQALSDRANAARVAQAMQMLGLMQEQEQAQARNAQAMEALNFQREDAKANREASSGQFWEGTLPARYAEIEGQREDRRLDRDLTKQHYDDASGQFWGGTLPMEYDRSARAERGQDRQFKLGVANLLGDITGAGQQISPALNAYLGQLDPGIAAAQTQAQQQLISDQVAKLTGTYRAADPKSRAVIETGLDPRVVEGLRSIVQPATSVTPNAVPQATGNFNPKVDALKLLEMLRQNDPATARIFEGLGSVHPPGGVGTAYEGSPLFNRKKAAYDKATQERAAMLAPYLFQLYGTKPINLNEA